MENNVFVSPDTKAALFCDGIYTLMPPPMVSNDAYNAPGTGYGGACASQVGKNGNILVDPQFSNEGQHDYELLATSPAIDASNDSAPMLPTSDMARQPRIVDGNGDGTAVVDMGAYEFAPQ